MKNPLFFLLFLTGISYHTTAQKSKYIVFFKDKISIENYERSNFFSAQSWTKKVRKNIAIDSYDMPVKDEYTNVLSKQGFQIASTSKWLNAALIISEKPTVEFEKYPFVIKAISCNTKGQSKNKFIKTDLSSLNTSSKRTRGTINYGQGQQIVDIYEMDYLHDKGYLGNNVTVAFLDAGFDSMNVEPYMDSLFLENRVLDTYDFINGSTDVYNSSLGRHGTSVSARMLANKTNDFVGLAPKVTVLLYATDDKYTETYQDEYNFVRALERADSVGVDVVNASIGYRDFDTPLTNYIYADMDGKTSISTNGCRIASNKGILIVNSAGNRDRISAPADADSILAVGGAFSNLYYDNISSIGPSFDQRIKPDVAGITRNTFGLISFGVISTGVYSGTSAASPQIASMAALLVQAHPWANHMEIINAIKQSGHQSNNPDSLMGYGVPNARIADSILNQSVGLLEKDIFKETIVYPIPFHSNFYFKSSLPILNIDIYSIQGKKIMQFENIKSQKAINASSLPSGSYFLELSYDGETKTQIITKE